MSAEGDSGPGRREVAYRLFAAEFDDASLSYSESDEERAPNYVVTPTGLRVNRLFAVGVLTESESINEETIRGRIADPTGAFVTYAGQYQPEAQAFLDRATPPAFVAITGKARTFEPEDSDRVFTSVRPESLSEVEAATRDRWAVTAAESTLDRIAVCAAAIESSLRGEELQDALAEAGVGDSLAVGIPRALDHYGTTTAYLEDLRRMAVETLELVADEREEVGPLDLAPSEGGETALGPLPAADIDLSEPADEPPATESPVEPAAESESTAEPATNTEPESSPSTESVDEPAAEPTDPTHESAEGSESIDEAESSDPATGSVSEPSGESVAEPAAEATDDVAESAPTDTETASDDAATTETAPEDAADTGTDPDDAAATADESGMYQLDDEEREELESEFDTGFSSGNEVDPAGEADIDVPDADELAERAEAVEGETEPTAEAETEPAAEDSSPSTGEGGLGDFQDDLDGEADTGLPDEPAGDAEPAAETADSGETSTAAADEQPVGDQPADDQPAADIDLEDAVVETMARLDDGDGVDRATLVADLADSHGVDDAAIQEAIDDALMGGRCYEPADGTLKAI